MPVKNAMPYLDAAIESILSQTFGDFEFVIGDDGSTDGSSERLREWAAKDARIRLLARTESGGPVDSSNWVANAATGRLVARMDGDDIALPDRLEREVAVLARFPDVALVGSLYDAIDENGRVTRRSEEWRLSQPGFALPVAHGSIMYRKAMFDAAGGYAAGTEYYEDHDLYQRIAKLGRILVIARPLYRYRFSTGSARLHIPLSRLSATMSATKATPPPPHPETRRERLQALRLIGLHRIWSGGRPRVLRRLFRERALGWDLASAKTLFMLGSATLAPAGFRAARRSVLGMQARGARRVHPKSELFEWKPGTGARAVAD